MIAALVVPVAGARPDAQAIGDGLGAGLAPYKRPRRIVLVNAVPVNAVGSVQKNEFKERFEDTFSTA